MPRDFYVQLLCPVCLYSQWTVWTGVEMTRDEVLNRITQFSCPVHGLQRERPFQARERVVMEVNIEELLDRDPV